MDETNCKYVGSRGLLKSCDVTIDNIRSSTSELPDFSKMFDYCTMHVCSTAIILLSNRMDEIKHKFILVSGDSDEENYNQLFSNESEFLNFINNDKIVHWFSQNCTVDHPKVTRMPIGLDYHTFSKDKNSPVEQENVLINIKNSSKPFHERINKCYMNFSPPPDIYHYKYDRDEALRDIPHTISIKEKEKQDRDICWQNQTKYAFVVSPYGHGLDCHRTWEALILGCIPIIRTSGIDPLFDGLPVLFINNWSDLTQELLDNTVEKMIQLKNSSKNMDFEYEKLELKYWTDKINLYKKQNIENFANYDYGYENNTYQNNMLFILLIIFIVLLFDISPFLKFFLSNKKKMNKII